MKVNQNGFWIVCSLTIILFLYADFCPAKDQAQPKNTRESSFLKGIFGTYPILSADQEIKFAERIKTIRTKLDSLQSEEKRLFSRLDHFASSDTVVRRHITFFGGLLTIPKITEKEKEQTQKIKQTRKRLIEVTHAIQKLQTEETEILELMQSHSQYVEKRILWGFITWEEKRKSQDNKLFSE